MFVNKQKLVEAVGARALAEETWVVERGRMQSRSARRRVTRRLSIASAAAASDFASVCIRKIRSDAKVPFPMCRKSRFQHGELVYFARRLPAMGLRRHRNIIPHRCVLKIYESRLLLKHNHIHTHRVWLRGGGEYTPWCTSVAN
jgi:hypothetical protein